MEHANLYAAITALTISCMWGFPVIIKYPAQFFIQDKYQNLKHLCDMANNTFVTPITSDGEYDDEMLEDLKRYTDKH